MVIYPNEKVLHDYLCWRQVDCHINNLYNTCFWTLVGEGKSEREAEKILRVTDSSGKNEILFSRGINYNNELPMHRKGSIVARIEVFCSI